MDISLSLEMVFPDRLYTERIERAAALGVAAVEFWSWRDKRLEEIAAAADGNGLEVAAFSANREFAPVDARQHDDLAREVAASIRAALRLRCPNLMLLTDTLAPDGKSTSVSPDGAGEKRANVVAALKRLAPLAAHNGVKLLLEPLNTRIDHAGCYLESSVTAAEILEEAGSPAVKLLYDVYHMRTMGEDAPQRLQQCSAWLGHVHAAGVPGRGELDPEYQAVAGALQQSGYRGYVGLEFAPHGAHDEAIRAAVKMFKSSGRK
jgi:hydroxypyruvate isomerase